MHAWTGRQDHVLVLSLSVTSNTKLTAPPNSIDLPETFLHFPFLALLLVVSLPFGIFSSVVSCCQKFHPLRCKLHVTSSMKLSLFFPFGSDIFLLIFPIYFSVNDTHLYILSPYHSFEFQVSVSNCLFGIFSMKYSIDPNVICPHPTNPLH